MVVLKINHLYILLSVYHVTLHLAWRRKKKEVSPFCNMGSKKIKEVKTEVLKSWSTLTLLRTGVES